MSVDNPLPDHPSAPAPSQPASPPPSQPPSAGTADSLALADRWTRRLIAVISVIVVGVSILGIVGVMCYRVAIDGNSSLTNDITTKLMWLAFGGFASMVAALFGSNSIISKTLDKVLP